MKVLALLFVILILTSAFSTNFIFKSSKNVEKLTNYVCKITKDIIKMSSGTKDVLFGNLDTKSWTSTVNNIAECIGHETAILVSDFKDIITEKTLRKAAVAVLTLEAIDDKIVNSIIQRHHHSTVWHFQATIIIVIENKDHSKRVVDSAIEQFSELGFLNVAIIHSTDDECIQTYIKSSIVSQKMSTLCQPNSSMLLPDKLKNLNGFAYKIVVHQQNPRVRVNNGNIETPMLYFLKAMNEIQNSTFEITQVKNSYELFNYWMQRKMHLTLNSGIYIKIQEPQLLTYEENAYCALVPLPEKTNIFKSIFIEPFDAFTWMFFLLSIVCSVFVWWMFRNCGAVDSPWLLAYGMFVMFVGQGVDFSRKNHLVLTILLQLIIVMIWILSNAYEGIITSFMIEPFHEHKLETFDDLVASDFMIMADELFASKIKGSEASNILELRLNTSGTNLGNRFSFELSKKNHVFILTCEQVEIIIDVMLIHVNRKVSDFYYILPQKFVPSLVTLHASYLNPILSSFQYYMDLSFQAGLMHIWNIYASENSPFKKKDVGSVNRNYLRFEDLAQVLGIFVIGLFLSAAIFIAEIFFHDILRELKLAIQARKLRNQVQQMAYKKRKQPKHPKYQKGALYYIIHRRKRSKRLKSKKLKVRRVCVQSKFHDE